MDDPELKNLMVYSGREVRLEVGSKQFRYDPMNQHPEDLRQFLKDGLGRRTFDVEETPVSIDARKGIVYGDVIKVLDVVIEEQFQKVSFAGTFEQD